MVAACCRFAPDVSGQTAPDIEQLKAEVAQTERVDGPDSPALAAGLDKLAALYQEHDRYGDAEPLYVRALAIREKSLGPEHPDVAASLNNLASLYLEQSRYGEAEPLHKRALAIREKSLGPEHLDVAESLNNLASLYLEQGRYGEAEPLHQRGLAISEKSLGPEHPDVATSLNNLAMLYLEQGRYGEAGPLYRRSLAIREKALGSEHPAVATALSNLAFLHQAQGRYGEAEPLYKRSLAIREKSLGAEHRTVAASLNNLASLYQDQGRYGDAEPLLVRSLAIREKALGAEHSEVAGSLNNLALLYQAQGRHGDAEPLYMRGLAIWEKSFGPEHPELASFLNNLATLYRDQGRHGDAGPPFKRALAIREKSLGPEHPAVAISLSNLASLYRSQGRYGDAGPLFERALAIREKSLGAEHPDVALSLNNLALLYQAQGRHGDAEALYTRALGIAERSLGPEHLDVARSLNNLADLRRGQGRDADALPFARRASAIYRQRILAATDDNSPREAAGNRVGFFRHLALLGAAGVGAVREPLIEESFAIAQLAQATGTGVAVAKMAARFSQGNDALATLVKRKQDLVERLRKGESDLIKAASEAPEKRDRLAEQNLRGLLAQSNRDLAAVDAELQSRFPQYQALTRPEPLEVRAVQALMHPDEALIVYSIAPDAGWSWVIRPGQAAFLPLDVKEKVLAEAVNQVRAQMQPDPRGMAAPVDVRRLHELYRRVFAPAVAHLAGVRHVMVVPAGALQSLPFGMLVASPPKAIRSPADYRKVDWLANRYAISVLPSVGSIRALREFAKPAIGQKPFAGFGDPHLTDSAAPLRGRQAQPTLAAIFRNLNVKGTHSSQLDIADVRAIKRAPSLPETADELRAMAKTLKAGDGSLWLRDAATESTVKSLDLSKFRVIAFATHGLMAGELSGIAEPGLILTPPQEGTAEDDGYLSAAEIAQLKLNADWVLLSACNTAAADGTPGAEGLSGLGKAFFYAGSRSLLVSHWPVASEATVLLTTGMLREYEKNPARGKAQALRRAMLALRNAPTHPEHAHPFFWAPFVLVGEGGAR